MVSGSHCEPIYPPEQAHGHVHAQNAFEDLHAAQNGSHLDDSVNTLTQIVKRYPPATPVPQEAGDVLFFDGHLLHCSYPNRTRDRWRRSFVCHYCNARSWVPWNHGVPYVGESANGVHILARGSTHLAFASPQYGIPVGLLDERARNESPIPPHMVGDESGEMVMA